MSFTEPILRVLFVEPSVRDEQVRVGEGIFLRHVKQLGVSGSKAAKVGNPLPHQPPRDPHFTTSGFFQACEMTSIR